MPEHAPLRRRRPVARCWPRHRSLAVVGALLVAAPAMHAPPLPAQPALARADSAGLKRLEEQITELAKIAGGKVGVAIVHLETGRSLYVNRGERFPMASTFKVPVAVQVLSRVDRGEIRMDSLIALQPGDLHPGSGTLTELFNNPGVVLSVRNLMELMLRISDNSAADIMLRTAGGAPAVNARLQALGVTGIQLDRPTVRLIADYIGIKNLPSDTVTPAQFGVLARAVSDAERQEAVNAFVKDPKDTSTPEAMARLLEKIWRKQALSPASSALLLDIMYRCVTGAERIKGMLPPGTAVAHKTGTLGGGSSIRGGGTINDAGIIDLPNNAGHLVIVVLVKEAEQEARGERAIAQIARAAYDYFVFNPGAPTAARTGATH